MDDEEENRLEAKKIRLTIVEGHLTVFDRWSEFTALVLGSPDKRSAIAELQRAPFGFSEIVASYLVDLQVGRATAEGRLELEREAVELRRSIG